LLFQYFAHDGRKRFLPLGPYDASGARGLSLPGRHHGSPWAFRAAARDGGAGA
jgi:hypothetical protein